MICGSSFLKICAIGAIRDIPRLWPWIVVAPPPARPAVLERNPYYWKVDPEGNQLPYIDRMTFEIFDPETINLKAINGEIGMQGRHLQFQNYPLFMEGRKKGDYSGCALDQWIGGIKYPGVEFESPRSGNEADYRGSSLSKSSVARAESRMS